MFKTLKDAQAAPLAKRIDFSAVPLQQVAAQIDARQPVLGSGAEPEVEALRFYMLNHAMADLGMKNHKEAPLSAEAQALATKYIEDGSQIAERLFYYLLLICTRESRHVHNMDTKKLSIQAQYGDEVYKFLSKIKGTSSTMAANALKSMAPDTTLGNYTAHLESLFFNGGFSSGYGGKAWGEVAKCLNRFVHGELSAEMMVDTGWTLAHNNGPIFNKGMLYTGYTHELKTLLDVQRSGQIPQLMWDQKNGMSYIMPSYLNKVMPVFVQCAALGLSQAWETSIDWQEVEKLGSVGSYPSFIKKQKLAKGESVTAPAAVPQNLFYVSPGVSVKKITRAELLLA